MHLEQQIHECCRRFVNILKKKKTELAQAFLSLGWQKGHSLPVRTDDEEDRLGAISF